MLWTNTSRRSYSKFRQSLPEQEVTSLGKVDTNDHLNHFGPIETLRTPHSFYHRKHTLNMLSRNSSFTKINLLIY